MSALWATLAVGTPLVAAVVAVVAPRARRISASLAVAVMLAAALALAHAVTQAGRLDFSLGGWAAPLGIGWRIDGLTVAMLLVTGIVALFVTLYARHYFDERASHGARFYWPISMMLLASLGALFLSNDLFHWYVTLELLSLSAVALVTLAGKRAALKAAQKYLYASLLGSLCYLMGVAVLYQAYGTLDLTLLGDLAEASTPLWVALSLMIAGLLMKSAVFPLHFWLPDAHGSAPAPVSALLSALVVKGAFYILLRLWVDLVPPDLPTLVPAVLGALGAIAIVWGSIKALQTTRLKMLVAYSTVAQLGYLALFFPLSAGDGAAFALTGAIYFVVAHACAKGAMFLAAGNLQRTAGHDDLQQLSPAARALPVSMFAFALGGVSIMGLPPSGGFMAKWTLLNAALLNDAWHWAALMVAGGLFSAAYVFRALSLSFHVAENASPVDTNRGTTRRMEWLSLALASVALLLGINAMPMLELAGIGLIGLGQ